MFTIGWCYGAVRGAPDHVCHEAVSGCCLGCCSVCSGSCLPLGGVRVLSRVLCRGGVRGAPDHVCHWAVPGGCPGFCPGCCLGCSGSCLSLGGARGLSRVLSRVFRIMFAMVLYSGAVQGAPDHVCYWAVLGCCWGCCPGCSGSCLRLGGVRIYVCHWAVSGCCPGCCPGCSGSCLPLGGVSPGCCRWGVLSRVLRIMFAMVLSRVLSSGAVQGAPDHVCHWVVSGCCSHGL